MWTYLDAIALSDGAVYIAGAGNVTKVNESSSDDEWSAGFIGSVSTTGLLNWLHTVSLSPYNDAYYYLRVTSDALYAVGAYGAYATSSDDHRYGLALISEFDKSTGAETYHLGFGGADYASGFNSILPGSPDAVCAGWTNQFTSGGGYQAWYARVNLADTGGAGANVLPVYPAAAGAKILSARMQRPDNSRWTDR
jgi:hypothetical protein